MISQRDIVYATPQGLELKTRVYRHERGHEGRDANECPPAVISVHGGAWCNNDRSTAHLLDSALAQSGLAVFALDFRQGPQFKFPAASQDICAAVRFVRANAGALQVSVERLGLIGASSGGQLALLSALTPNAAHHLGTPIVNLPMAGPDGQPSQCAVGNSDVSFVAALWPVSDPLRRYKYAQDAGMDRLVESSLSYFGDEEQMHAASIQRILDDGEAQSLPAVWVAQPGADSNVPQAMTLDLLRAYQARGGSIHYAFYPEQPHAFTYEQHEAAQRCIADAAAFMWSEINA